MKARILSLIILLFFSLLSFSVNVEWKTGAIITQEGDTIRGLIGYSGRELSGRNCLFKDINSSKEIVYTADELKGYILDSGLFYETLHFDNSKIKGSYFAQCLVKGILSLYYLSVLMTTEETYRRYVALNEVTGRITEWTPSGIKAIKFVEVQRNQKILEVLMQATPELSSEIRKIKSDEMKLIELFKKYHDLVCNEYECILYVESKKIRSLWLTTSLGGQINLIDYSGYLEQLKNSALDCSPNIQVDFSINLDKYTQHWLFNVGLNLYMVDFYKEGYRQLRETQDITFKSFNIENSFGVQYNWLNNYYFLLEGGLYQVGTIIRENDIKISRVNRKYELEYRNWAAGAFVGVGYEFYLKNSNSVPVKLRYKKSLVGKYKFGSFIQHDVLSLNVGYRFKL